MEKQIRSEILGSDLSVKEMIETSWASAKNL